jgi:hypothetical protein
MIGWNIRKKSAHDGAQTARDPLHQPGPLRQTHYAQPQRHDADQPQRDRNCCFRAIERAAGHIFQAIVPAANCDRE